MPHRECGGGYQGPLSHRKRGSSFPPRNGEGPRERSILRHGEAVCGSHPMRLPDGKPTATVSTHSFVRGVLPRSLAAYVLGPCYPSQRDWRLGGALY